MLRSLSATKPNSSITKPNDDTYLGKSRRPANHQPNLAPQLVPRPLSPLLRAEGLWKRLHELGVDGGHGHEHVDVVVGRREQLPHEVRVELGHHRDLGADGQGAQESVNDAMGVVQGQDVQDIVLGNDIPNFFYLLTMRQLVIDLLCRSIPKH